MKKILMITETLASGVFTYLYQLCNALCGEYAVYLACSSKRRETPRDFRRYFDPRVQILEVSHFAREIRPGEDAMACLELRRIVNRVQPDLVHLHSSKAGVLGRWAINGRKVPLFYTPHGYSFLMADRSAGKRLAYWLLEWLSARRPCTTISCSPGEHVYTQKLTKRAACVHNGIDVEPLLALRREAVGENPEPFTVVTLGRICAQKDPVRFREIAEAMPDVRFLWVGDGELREELSTANITITGWKTREEALRILSRAGAFLLTSRWEGLPISLLEAMALGKPCVVSDAVGNRDVITDGKNGCLCRSWEEFVEALSAIRRGPDTLGAQASRDVQERYSVAAMAAGYRDIYASGLQTAKKGRGSP